MAVSYWAPKIASGVGKAWGAAKGVGAKIGSALSSGAIGEAASVLTALGLGLRITQDEISHGGRLDFSGKEGGINDTLYTSKQWQRLNAYTKQNLGADSVTNTTQVIDMAVAQGLLSEKDAKLTKEYLKWYDKSNGEDNGLETFYRSVGSLFQTKDKNYGTGNQAEAVKRGIEAGLKVVFPKAVNIDEYLDSIYNTGNIPTPQYMSQINPDTDKLPVPEAKWYTGQEMADLFDIKYDPDYYYNLIKQGTEAAVEAQQYQNDQAIAASMLDDAVSRSQYLQSIDNSKADAVIKGSTLGQRMANELLANANAANAYATNQADVYNQAFTNIQDAINKDAQAGITANNYYNKNVFQPIGTNIEDLYYNDINRIGAIKNYNANIYAANQAYNAAAVQANAEMDAAYNNVVGSINAAKNEYRKVYDAFYNSNYNPYKNGNNNDRNIWAFNQAQAYYNRNNPNAEVKD